MFDKLNSAEQGEETESVVKVFEAFINCCICFNIKWIIFFSAYSNSC